MTDTLILLAELDQRANDIDRAVRAARAGTFNHIRALNEIALLTPGLIRRLGLLREGLEEKVS